MVGLLVGSAAFLCQIQFNNNDFQSYTVHKSTLPIGLWKNVSENHKNLTKPFCPKTKSPFQKTTEYCVLNNLTARLENHFKVWTLISICIHDFFSKSVNFKTALLFNKKMIERIFFKDAFAPKFKNMYMSSYADNLKKYPMSGTNHWMKYIIYRLC